MVDTFIDKAWWDFIVSWYDHKSSNKISYMFNAFALPRDPRHPLYQGGLETINFHYGNKWHRLDIFSVRVFYRPAHQEFVLYRTSLGKFAFIADTVHLRHFGAFVPHDRTEGIFDYFWVCFHHSRFTDMIVYPKECRSICPCGSDAQGHCSTRALYNCMKCGTNVPCTAQLCAWCLCSQ